MNVPRLLISGVAAMTMASAFAQSPPAADPGASPSTQRGATFESLDTDSDGRISKSEAAANEGVSSQFARYDKNGDGFIERSEVNSANGSSSSQSPSQSQPSESQPQQ